MGKEAHTVGGRAGPGSLAELLDMRLLDTDLSAQL
jgi:hypothetical protein